MVPPNFSQKTICIDGFYLMIALNFGNVALLKEKAFQLLALKLTVQGSFSDCLGELKQEFCIKLIFENDSLLLTFHLFDIWFFDYVTRLLCKATYVFSVSFFFFDALSYIERIFLS